MKGYGAMREGRALLHRALGGDTPGNCESSGDEDLEGEIRRTVVARPEERPASRRHARRIVATLFLVGAVGLTIAAIVATSTSMATDADEANMAKAPVQRTSNSPTGSGSVNKGTPSTTEDAVEDFDNGPAPSSSDGSTVIPATDPASDFDDSALADAFFESTSDSQSDSIDNWMGDASDELDGSWLDGSTGSELESGVYRSDWEDSTADSASEALVDSAASA